MYRGLNNTMEVDNLIIVMRLFISNLHSILSNKIKLYY